MAVVNGVKKELPIIGFKRSRSSQIHRTTLASVESLTMPLIQEVVISADFQCVECQKRIAAIISRMNEMESVEVNVLEKKVTLTCRPTSQVAAIYRNPFRKVALIKQIFCNSW
ncbi:hypothetical protein AAG906_031839 [Vitis piasezkii]|uniref:uncharacterized protein LOC117914619 isoform X2 n=1 Tax=Vitis riparia TaxID=96939 RepID=UPI00053FCCB2|nr:uncharacterized protein LOC117914619 isoform X2 [Vitis riparia]|eukprot:XP_010647776.1 PREDICTED: uncharacterized protein LOC100266408 isoform X2 [Vitis vinifera]